MSAFNQIDFSIFFRCYLRLAIVVIRWDLWECRKYIQLRNKHWSLLNKRMICWHNLQDFFYKLLLLCKIVIIKIYILIAEFPKLLISKWHVSTFDLENFVRSLWFTHTSISIFLFNLHDKSMLDWFNQIDNLLCAQILLHFLSNCSHLRTDLLYLLVKIFEVFREARVYHVLVLSGSFDVNALFKHSTQFTKFIEWAFQRINNLVFKSMSISSAVLFHKPTHLSQILNHVVYFNAVH